MPVGPIGLLVQCNNRGRCNEGFCLCEHGWQGIDCSIPNIIDLGNGVSSFVRPNAKAPYIYVYELPSQYNTGVRSSYIHLFSLLTEVRYKRFLSGAERTQYSLLTFEQRVLLLQKHAS